MPDQVTMVANYDIVLGTPGLENRPKIIFEMHRLRRYDPVESENRLRILRKRHYQAQLR